MCRSEAATAIVLVVLLEPNDRVSLLDPLTGQDLKIGIEVLSFGKSLYSLAHCTGSSALPFLQEKAVIALKTHRFGGAVQEGTDITRKKAFHHSKQPKIVYVDIHPSSIGSASSAHPHDTFALREVDKLGSKSKAKDAKEDTAKYCPCDQRRFLVVAVCIFVGKVTDVVFGRLADCEQDHT